MTLSPPAAVPATGYKPPRQPTSAAVTSLWFVSRSLFTLSLVAAVVLMLDPTSQNWGLGSSGAVKYLPVILCVGSVAVNLVANPLSIMVLLKPANAAMLGLAVFMAVGSFAAQESTGKDLMFTYMGRAMNIIPFFAAALCMQQGYREALEERFGRIIYWGGLVMILLILLSELKIVFGFRGAFQNQTPLAVGAALAAMWLPKGRLFKAAWALLAVGVFLAMGKYTSLLWAIVIFAVFALVNVAPWLFRGGAPSSGVKSVRTVLAVAAVALLVLLGTALFQSKREVASTDARWPVFQQRISEFMESPIYGSHFKSSPLVSIGNLVIPTHNDYLEVLSGGGLVALGLLLVAVAAAMSRLLKMYQNGIVNYGYRTAVAGILITSLINMMSNPMLFLTATSYMVWASLGIMANFSEPARRRP